ncbi:hypothetical protein HNP32_000657 [Brevundimonas bullata]|uniref:DUF1223 domain-containing protein n=1 Tax=Brevundimonas bullata TaxID=13160 RepID=A0A7W7IM86_9CAUL|nr:DUF1223 domain-containing protein [Brevundimonas bullata]MBB4796943.1 hypothetical protein [Brevundimonas bullata]MBB6381902.1 hypothetical protein [Brevundimonas bullata]
MTARGSIRFGMIAATVAGVGLLTAAAGPPRERDAAVQPVVVELFTAQGCSGCPDANRTLEAVANAPGVIALTYGVGYWDYLGWSDTFAKPEFAARQQAYRQALKLRNVSTPQVVIDGRRQVSGARSPELQAAIDAEAAARLHPPEIEFRETGDRVGVGSGRPPRGGAEILAVIYQPGLQTVEVRQGDNRGQQVRHVNVVREVRRLGDWSGRPVLFALPGDSSSEDNVVVLVQAKADRRILSAARRAEPRAD